MSEIEKLNMIAEWQEQYKQLIEDLDNSKKRIAELEKENAELKEEMKAKQVVLNDFKSRVETVTDRFNKKSSQLTKAKEIIKLLLWDLRNRSYEPVKDVEQAEQFLKE